MSDGSGDGTRFNDDVSSEREINEWMLASLKLDIAKNNFLQ